MDGGLALTSDGSGSVETLELASPNTMGEQKTLVMLVNFQDNPSRHTPACAERLLHVGQRFLPPGSFNPDWVTGDVAG